MSFLIVQLYDTISCRVLASHRLASPDAMKRYRHAAEVLRELPRSIRDSPDVRELRAVLTNPFLKVSFFHYWSYSDRAFHV